MSPTVRWLAIALLVSVGLNMFLVGFGIARNQMERAGVEAGGGPDWTNGRPGSERWRDAAAGVVGPFSIDPKRLRAVARDLSEADLAVLRETVGAKRPEIRRLITNVREARHDLGEILSAPDLDRETLVRAFAELSAATGAVQTALHETLTDALVDLSPDGRERMAAEIAARRHR